VQSNHSNSVHRQRALEAPVFLRLPSVLRLTGLGRSTIYRLMAEHQFPNPVRLGPRAVAWRSTDLDQWSAERPVSKH
jgi:prophage regulatory protein